MPAVHVPSVSPTPDRAADAAATPRRKRWIRRHRMMLGLGAAGLVAAIAAGVALASPQGGSVTSGAQAPRASTPPVAVTATHASEPPSEEAARALASAQTYLDRAHLSRWALIEQLTSAYANGYAKDAAAWAVDALGVDWDVEAFQAALDYLDRAAFSRAGLVAQLAAMHGGQFTLRQAEHAVSIVGADWKEQAVEVAEEYLAYGSYTREGLIDQLTSDHGARFTRPQALYAVAHVDL